MGTIFLNAGVCLITIALKFPVILSSLKGVLYSQDLVEAVYGMRDLSSEILSTALICAALLSIVSILEWFAIPKADQSDSLRNY